MSFFKKKTDVESIEIEIKRPKLRIFLFIFLIATAIVAIGYWVASGLSTKAGWQEVQVVGKGNEHVGGDFSLFVFLKGGFMDQTGKRLSAAYSQAAGEAYQIFHSQTTFAGMNNLARLNQNPNTEIEIHPALYKVLKKLEEAGNRLLYLGPVYEEYRGLFLCEEEGEAAEFDPAVNEDVREYIEEALVFCKDPEHVNIELKEDYKACLRVSEEYLAFVKENQIETIADFSWMKNAFAADHVADALAEFGVDRGYLVSNDGYIRCIDETDISYYLELTEWRDFTILATSVLKYTGPAAFVIIRGYPVLEPSSVNDLYYVWKDGRTVTGYIDPEDGLSHVAAGETVYYGYETSCTDILLKMYTDAVNGTFEEERAEALKSLGVYTICRKKGVYQLNDPKAVITDIDEMNQAE